MLSSTEQWLWDVNGKGSEIKKLADDERMYHLLANVEQTTVIYHAKVRNTSAQKKNY
jgi:hypothetical protein